MLQTCGHQRGARFEKRPTQTHHFLNDESGVRDADGDGVPRHGHAYDDADDHHDCGVHGHGHAHDDARVYPVQDETCNHLVELSPHLKLMVAAPVHM